MPLPASNSAMGRLVAALNQLPGVGNRSAQRFAFHLLKAPPDEARALAQAILDLKNTIKQCAICGNAAESDPCPICADPRRDHSLVLVVEQPNDVATMEATGMYRGVYHVLMGRLSPLDGVGTGDLNIAHLLDRVKGDSESASDSAKVREVIIGTNPTLEGDGTALYLVEELTKLNVKVSRLARGMPAGGTLQTVSKAVLADALQGRQMMGN